MDEPFGAIDPIARERLQNELLRLQQVVRKTIVFVTHDIDEAIRLGDRVALFSKGGHLEQYATPAELLAHPASDFVAGFLGEARMVRRLSLISVGDIRLAQLNGAPPPGGDRRCAARRCAMRSTPCCAHQTGACSWSASAARSVSSMPT